MNLESEVNGRGGQPGSERLGCRSRVLWAVVTRLAPSLREADDRDSLAGMMVRDLALRATKYLPEEGVPAVAKTVAAQARRPEFSRSPYALNEFAHWFIEHGMVSEALPLLGRAVNLYSQPELERKAAHFEVVRGNLLAAVRAVNQEGIRLHKMRELEAARGLFEQVMEHTAAYLDSHSDPEMWQEREAARSWQEHTPAGFRPQPARKKKKGRG